MHQNKRQFIFNFFIVVLICVVSGILLMGFSVFFIYPNMDISVFIETMILLALLATVIILGFFCIWIDNKKRVKTLYKELQDSHNKLKSQLIKLVTKENLVKSSEERYNFVINTLKIGIWDYDATTQVTYIAPQLYKMFGFSAEDFQDFTKKWHRRIHPQDRLSTFRKFREKLTNKVDNIDCQFRYITKFNEYRWVQAVASAKWDEQGNLLRFAGSITDIDEAKQDEEKIKRMAYYDSLTGLPNRAYLHEYVNKVIKSGKMAAFIFIDIDNFKYVNDSFGHNLGDSVIIEMSKRISGLVANGIVARWGGDEIIVILENIKSQDEVCELTGNMIRKVYLSFSNKGITVNLSISAGVAIFPNHGSDFETLLMNADTAMYSAKDSGKNKFKMFDIKMNEVIYQKMKYEGLLRDALEKNELELYFQPQYDMKTGALCGVEALMRWYNEELGDVTPCEFIPVAESSGLIIPLGLWAFTQACKFQVKLNSLGYNDIAVAINFSALQFKQEDFIDYIKSYIVDNKVNPQMLEFEITESVLLDSTDITIAKLKELQKIGIKIALDDFGKGYSSLTYLKLFPIDILKMDRSFIENVTVDKADQDISGLIVNVAHSLGLKVVAEGIETIEQRELLLNIGCDIAQGFLYSKPIKDIEFFEMLK